MGAVEGWKMWSQRRVLERERGANRGMHKENGYPKPLAWKRRGAEFCELLQPEGLKAWSFKGQGA